ncbi:MAG: lyase family protein, partial [Candidatus Thermoplasmatota archaeon]|nr:lyase family protein [Candidatus Thermoplasmatota archaeon]
MKLWGKNYSLNKQIEKFTVDNDCIIDQKLIKYDCAASIAHAKMLAKIGILSKDECNKIIGELNKMIKLDSIGKFTIKQEDEDGHTSIEKHLTQNLGKVGKKIHTARSRNDQVLTALRLYYKDEIKTVLKLIDNLVGSLLILKEKYGNVEMPGYTHMRKAMPSSVGLWAGAFIESMKDNKILLSNVYKLIDQSP